MPSIVHQTPDGKHLIGGLDWRLLPATGSIERSLREGASDRGASHAVLSVATTAEAVSLKGKNGDAKKKEAKRINAGFYSPPDGSKAPKNAHSLAAAFAQWARQHGAALLNVRTNDGLYAVVVVINGLPVLDTLEKSSTEAQEKARPYIVERADISLFSDDLERYPSSLLAEGLLEQISNATGKATTIKAVPLDVAKIAAVAVLVLAVIGGFMYHSKWKAEKTRQQDLARLRDADPVPRYLNALAAARQAVGIQRPSLRASVAAAMNFPLVPEGWRVTKLGCTVALGCTVHLFRSTGTYSSLQAAMPMLELSPAADINLNEARMTWKQELKPQGLDPVTQLPTLGGFLRGNDASTLQTWLVAGVAIQLVPPTLWPQAPGIPQAFKHPQALASGSFEISALALPQVAEVIDSAPQNVNWTGWSIDIGDVKQEPLSRAKARLTGNYYVTNVSKN